MLPPWAVTGKTPTNPDGAYQTAMTSAVPLGKLMGPLSWCFWCRERAPKPQNPIGIQEYPVPLLSY